MKIISSRNSEQLSEDIATYLGVNLVERRITKFVSEEFDIEILEDLKDEHVFLVSNSFPSVHESLIEIFLLVGAIKKSGADKITLILPYLAYARQDIENNITFSALALVLNILKTIGASKIISIDVHSQKAKSISDIELESLDSMSLIKEYINKKEQIEVLVGADSGRSEFVKQLSKETNLSYALLSKQRFSDTSCKSTVLEGDVSNKSVLLIDDIIDTGNTLAAAAEALKNAGARTIDAFVTHGLFAVESIDLIKKSYISSLTTTDSINNMPSLLGEISVVSIVKELSNSINSNK